MKEKIINWLIKNLKVDTNKISDGYHEGQTLKELGDKAGIPSLESSYRDWATKLGDGNAYTFPEGEVLKVKQSK